MMTAFENRLQSVRFRLQGSALGQFLRWWTAELGDMLPARMKAGMEHARRKVVMKISGSELSLSVQEADSLQEVEAVSLDQDSRLLQTRLQDMLVDRELNEVQRDILLPESRTLVKEVVMPMASETSLRQALSFEMDRQTPFKAEDVFFDYRITDRDRVHSQIRVRMVVTPRGPLLTELQKLEQLGLSPGGVDVELDGVPADLNLLPPDMRKRMINSKARLNLGLGLAAIVLLALLMAQSLWLRQHQINEVTEAIDLVREEAMAVQAIRNRISDASEAAGFLNERRASSLPTVRVMDEVTRIMPDDTFLDRLLIESDSVQIQGKSQNAQRLIELVNQSPMFSDASFRGPTRLDTATQKEMFDINASLVVGGGGP